MNPSELQQNAKIPVPGSDSREKAFTVTLKKLDKKMEMRVLTGAIFFF